MVSRAPLIPRVKLPAIARQVSPAPLLVSLLCWLLLGAASIAGQALPLCAASQTLITAGLAFLAVYGAATTTMAGALLWIVMVIAMTAPLLGRPIAQLRLRSLVQRRDRSTGLFVAAYVLVWIAVGPALLAIANVLDTFATAIQVPAIVIAAALAALWQASPGRQRALNRCHRVPNLAAFGSAADRDCIAFGLTHGAWCVATCVPLMVLTLLVPTLHIPSMVLLSILLQLERLAPPRQACWTHRILPGQSVVPVLFRSIRSSFAVRT